MSLDVYLELPDWQHLPPRSGSGIFVREEGMLREISRAEWDSRFPDREPVTVRYEADYNDVLYDANITHNLGSMAEAAGIYEHLWRPDDVGIAAAEQLIEPLRAGLASLRSDPERFRALNPSNGWGTYEGLVSFVENYLEACERHPHAIVRASR